MAMRDRETAIATALGYLGQDAKGLWVESAIWMPASGDDEMLDQLRNVLERDLDDFEMRLACQHNRDNMDDTIRIYQNRPWRHASGAVRICV